MATIITWFDRKFTFDLPAGMYPNIVERLRGTPARAEDIVRGVPAETLTGRDGDTWSAQENIGHLLDLEPLCIQRVADILDGRPRLRDADLTNRKTHDANHNSASIDDILSSFRELRAKLVRQLDELPDSMIERTATHPRLEQPTRLLDWIFFVAEHDDHHLAHVTRLKRLERTSIDSRD